MKIVFLGTPDFSVQCLENLIKSHHTVLAVVTQPDRPRDRGKVSFSPVKECAVKNGIPVLQYEKVSKEGIEEIRALKPDIMVTAAFGQMLSREFLEIAPKGVINVHASLLPKYRGSSPIQWAVVNGEKETGITIMKTALKMDSGDIILQVKMGIGEDETAGELFDSLSALGAPALLSALKLIEEGKETYTPQDEGAVTYFPMLKKEDGKIDFNKTSAEIKSRVQGFNPWPSAYTNLDGKMIKIHKVAIGEGGGNAGEIIAADKSRFAVATADGAIDILELQPQNGRRMTFKEYLAGHKIEVGIKLL